MFNWKKKLGAIVPGDVSQVWMEAGPHTRRCLCARAHLPDIPPFVLPSLTLQARSQLQNALTVEWSGHKTVLVDVSSQPQHQDVELSPFGDQGGYGRLGDDDEGRDGHDAHERDAEAEERYDGYGEDVNERRPSFVRGRLGRGRSSSTADAYGQSIGPGTRAHARSDSTPVYTGVMPRKAADVLGEYEGSAERRPNPFKNPFSHEDDYAAAAGMLPTPPPRDGGSTRARPPRPIMPSDIWDVLVGGATKSPTSSTGSGSIASSSANAASDPPFFSDRRW
jgi:hypothetical protein